jgi:16S rRNA processing protein RimM
MVAIAEVKIAYINGVRGIKGEVKALPLSDFPERYAGLKNAYLTKDISRLPCRIEYIDCQTKGLVIKMGGVDSREQAEKLRGFYLTVDKDEAFVLPQDTWYEYQIVGLSVCDENELDLGCVHSIIQTGANAVLLIKKDREKDLLLPMLKDVILKVDLENSRINVRVPLGLIDES